ncbi:MAG: DNA repair protein RadC [Desulfobacterales bacterium]|nr:DNA repair protein RadC [Desulfobacterales bacterium]
MATETRHRGAGHRKRLREKFLTTGLGGFHDYEVIELLLTLATPQKDCKDAAKAALKRFKSLPAVLEASAADLERVPGIGPVNRFGIQLARAVADRYLKARLTGKIALNNSRELFDYLYGSLRDKGRESFQAIFLDAKNRVLAAKTLFTGTLTASAVYPREVVRAALDHHAAAVIFAHNHPSGDPEPSADDVALTRQLVYACRVVGITVHEHIVIGDNRYHSFADHGRIAQMHQEYDRRFADRCSETAAESWGAGHGLPSETG